MAFLPEPAHDIRDMTPHPGWHSEAEWGLATMLPVWFTKINPPAAFCKTELGI